MQALPVGVAQVLCQLVGGEETYLSLAALNRSWLAQLTSEALEHLWLQLYTQEFHATTPLALQKAVTYIPGPGAAAPVRSPAGSGGGGGGGGGGAAVGAGGGSGGSTIASEAPSVLVEPRALRRWRTVWALHRYRRLRCGGGDPRIAYDADAQCAMLHSWATVLRALREYDLRYELAALRPGLVAVDFALMLRRFHVQRVCADVVAFYAVSGGQDFHTLPSGAQARAGLIGGYSVCVVLSSCRRCCRALARSPARLLPSSLRS